MPRRVVVGPVGRWERLPAGAVYVGPAAPGLPRSPYDNPFKPNLCIDPHTVPHGERVQSPEHAVELYRQWLRSRPDLVKGIRRDLAGMDAACTCKPSRACHGDVVVAVAAGGEP